MHSFILAIDTSTGPCSVAIVRNKHIVAFSEESRPHQQAAQLMTLVENALSAANIGYADIDAVAVTTGPGSFTGIRIGLAAARAIGMAAQKPVIGYTSLQVLVFAAQPLAIERDGIIVSMRAGKRQVFFQQFNTALPPQPVTESSAIDITALTSYLPAGHYLLCGSAQEETQTQCPSECRLEPSSVIVPDARALALLASNGDGSNSDALYLRNADAKLPSMKLTARN